MAAKLNVKFIGILGGSIAVALGLVAVLWLIQYRFDATRNVRAGDEAFAEGNYWLAKEMYGRAVSKEQTNSEYLEKYERAILAYQPQTRDEAREWYADWLGALNVSALYRGTDPSTHERLIKELIHRGRLIERDEVWREVETAADRMWASVPADNPRRIDARLYRGIAVSRRASVASPDEILAGEDHLEAYLEAHPESDTGWATLTMMQLALAERYRAEGRNSQYQEKLKELRETHRKGLEAVPGGFDMALADARVKAYLRTVVPDSVTPEAITQTVDRIVDLAETTEDNLQLLHAVPLLRQLGSNEAMRAIIDLVRSRVADDPQAIFEQLQVARVDLMLSELDLAEQFARKVIDAPRMTTSLVSQEQFNFRREAARILVDVAVRRWDMASAADKPAIMERVRAARQQLNGFVTDDADPLLLWSDGRIALIENDFNTAAMKFEQYLKVQREDLETMMLAAKALEEIKEYGVALDRVATVAESVPNSVPVLAQLARLQFNVGRPRDAEATLARAEKIEPGNPGIAALREVITSRTNRTADALTPNENANPLLVQAREAIEANDFDGARELLEQAATAAPNDLITLKMWFNLEVSAGNLQKARELIDRALKIAPEDRDLIRVSTLLAHEDPIEAVKAYINSTKESEADRVVALMVNLRALAAQQENRARQLESTGNTAEANKAKQLATRAAAEAEQVTKEAERLAPNDRSLIEHLFIRASMARDWTKAQEIVDRAVKADADRAGGALYRGRLALARGTYDEAIRAFLRATEQLSFSAYAWRLLGMAYEGAGNIADARRAYQRSYDCNPNDLATLRLYCELLVRIGDPTRAINVLRNATNLLPDTSPAVEYWLALEADHGDVATVLKRRRAMYERSKENTTNALQLAMLLGQLKPRRELILGPDGNPTIAANRWARFRADEQRKHLDDARNAWLDESEAILKELEKQGVRGLSVVNVRARNAMARNKSADGEKLLRDFIAAERQAGTLNVTAMLTLGQYLADVRRFEEARDVFVAARELQDPTRREADLMLGDLYFRGGRFEQAAQVYQGIVDVGANPATTQRLVECYIRIRQFDKAQTALDSLANEGASDYVNAMLEAAIAEGRGEDLFAAGKKLEAKREFERQRAALDRATTLAPSQPMPHVQRAISYLAEFGRDRDPSVLDQAMNALDTAASLRADFPAVSITRADVLIARGNLDAAIGELGRLLEKAPESLPVRRRLAELLLDSGRVNEAGNLILQAVELFPENAIWPERYGDLKVAQGDVNAAEPMYLRAFQVDPTRERLAKVATARLRMVPPKPREAADILAQNQPDVDADPALRGVFAEALHGTGRTLEALSQMRLSYRQLKDMIAKGNLPPEGIAQWYTQLRKLYQPTQFADADRFIRETAGDSIDVYDLQWIARIWSDGGSDGVKKAIEVQRQALEACPTSNAALRRGLLNDLSIFYLRLEDYQNAIEVMEQLVAEDPDNPMTLNNLAYLMGRRSHDLDKAISHAERASQLKPNDPNILDTLGFLYLLKAQATKSGDLLNKADETLRRSIDIFPMSATYLHLAQVLLEKGEPRFRVETAIRRAEELKPDAETRQEINKLLDDMRKSTP